MLGAIDLGLISGLMALGAYLTFRILDFPDLTVDGSFTTGAALTATHLARGGDPWVATGLGLVGGLVAGAITGVLSTKGRIHPLLAGILTQIALYSINLRIMGKPNVSLTRAETILTPLKSNHLLASGASIAIFALVVVLFILLTDWFLNTDMGLSLRATGANESMARANGINTDAMKILGLSASNGLVGLSGALVAQYQGFADATMGIGLIVAGLASVILGSAILRSTRVVIATVAVVIGSLLYRVIIQLAHTVGLDPNDMKLVSALIVIIALLVPRWASMGANSRRHRSHQRAGQPAVAGGPGVSDHAEAGA